MGNLNSNVQDLLGREVHASEFVLGLKYEYQGRCVGVIQTLPGADVGEAILLELSGGVCSDWLHTSDIVIHQVV